jgi:hypothetical protein
MTTTGAVTAAKRTKTMAMLGAFILVAVALYYAFMAYDGMGLETRSASAQVVGKDHRPAARTYSRQIINGQSLNVPMMTPEMFVLELDLAGRRVSGTTDRGLFEGIATGETVHVTYQQRRLTGALQVVSVSR